MQPLHKLRASRFSMLLLTINTGSSSIKLDVFHVAGSVVKAPVYSKHSDLHRQTAEEALGELVQSPGIGRIDAISHRIVHGGELLTSPALLNGRLEKELHRITPLAPLHNPIALAWIRACRQIFGPDIPQILVPDTGFFHALPEVAKHYALPRPLAERHHARRYGFHGLAHQSMWEYWQERHPRQSNGRVISLQLGAGCSAAAVVNGEPLDTSMGFTPLEGLMMATRCGDLDPGLLLYLQKADHLAPSALEELLNKASGLLGISGISGDIRVLLDSDDPNAALAVDLYCYRARKYIGAYLAVLGGADAILFGGGVGENASVIREKILQDLQWFGIRLDLDKNHRTGSAGGRIDDGSGRVHVWVAPVNEDMLLARMALRLLDQTKGVHNARQEKESHAFE